MEKNKNNKNKANTYVYDDSKLESIEIEIHSYKNEDFTSMNLPKNKDLIPGQYEGGIKLWECALDLCNFLPAYVGWHDLSNLNVNTNKLGFGVRLWSWITWIVFPS